MHGSEMDASLDEATAKDFGQLVKIWIWSGK